MHTHMHRYVGANTHARGGTNPQTHTQASESTPEYHACDVSAEELRERPFPPAMKLTEMNERLASEEHNYCFIVAAGKKEKKEKQKIRFRIACEKNKGK